MPTSPRYSQLEIERRWLCDGMAMLHPNPRRERGIQDHYILGTRLRLRKVTESNQPPIYKLGKKYESALDGTHQVVTTYLSEEEYKILERLPAKMAKKRRYSVYGGSLDVYEYPIVGLQIFEIEFKSTEEAAAYEVPQTLGEEITNHSEYSGFALARSEA